MLVVRATPLGAAAGVEVLGRVPVGPGLAHAGRDDLLGLVVGVGLGFGLGWKGVGIWIGLASGLAAVAVMLLARWMRRERLGLTDW